jgi:nucleoside phosphorylase
MACFYSAALAWNCSAVDTEAEGLICQLRPKLAIMIGFCGGVESKTNLGDILIAETAIDWDFGKWKPNASSSKLYSRPEPITIRGAPAHLIARRLVERGVHKIDGLAEAMSLRSAREITEPKIRLAPFASGSAVVADAHVLETLRSLNEDIGGVDMESYGFYYANRYSRAAKAEFLCIKAVADHCKPDKDDRLHDACCYASAELARHIVTREWAFDS